MSDLDEIEAALLAERAALLDSSSSLAAGAGVLSEAQAGGETKVRGVEEGDGISVELGTIKTMQAGQLAALAEIDDALARIKAGTYGTCLGCSDQIPLARLEARPRSAFCVKCASRR